MIYNITAVKRKVTSPKNVFLIRLLNQRAREEKARAVKISRKGRRLIVARAGRATRTYPINERDIGRGGLQGSSPLKN
jgi:hypothetical protein